MSFVVFNLGWWDLVLVPHKLGNLLVQSIPLLSVLFFNCFLEFALLKLRILVGFSFVDASKWVQEVIVSHNSFTTYFIHLVQNNWVAEFVCNDGIALFNRNKLLFK